MQKDFNHRRALVLGLASAWTLPLLGCGGGGTAQSASGLTIPTGDSFKNPALLASTAGFVGGFTATITAKTTTVQIADGAPTTIWAYNGITPGPMIDVQEGDTVSITFVNQLAQESTIHWHGLPIPADQDGNPMDPVLPGAERTYSFTLPIGSAGTYL